MCDQRLTLPGAVAVSRLRVYDGSASDGLPGGTPHVHLASAEAYLVLAGTGEVQSIDAGGYRSTTLTPGALVSFRPGTVHRLINRGGLDIVTLMQNAGLPEAGDAVMTFDQDALASPAAYAEAARLPAGDPAGDPAPIDAAVAARRDRALRGWAVLRAAADVGDPDELHRFLGRAQALVRARVPQWRRLVHDGVEEQAAETRVLLAAIEVGNHDPLDVASLQAVHPSAGQERYGMCGRLTTWPIDGAWAA
jgi:mannose-6-phosphate isomerase-like protein (cupin superfamily)